ncbi:MAG: DUF89 family protein [Chloroflexi bacterium]|nr:DUF89 family protein [Chloroflexota bacterium]
MKTFDACIPCITALMESTLENSDLPEEKKKKFLGVFQDDWSQADMSLPPARSAGAIYQNILQETGQEDLFKAHKAKSIQEALITYPRLKKLAERAADPFEAAIRISALGNILDIANPNSYNLEEEIERLSQHPLQGNSLEELRNKVAQSESLLILADNAGETVFDKVLIETLDIPVIYAVKSAPAFDDALLEDATQAGIDTVAQLMASGTPYPGTYLPSCSPDFQNLFQSAPLILAKGQGNFETLNDVQREIFFLLKVKCEAISREIGYPIGSLTLRYHSGTSSMVVQ